MSTNPLHTLPFSGADWLEIMALGFEPFEPEPGPLTRGQWIAIAHMAIGKAVCLDDGRYDDGPSDDDNDDNIEWAAQLRRIADVILGHFKPGDGNI